MGKKSLLARLEKKSVDQETIQSNEEVEEKTAKEIEAENQEDQENEIEAPEIQEEEEEEEEEDNEVIAGPNKKRPRKQKEEQISIPRTEIEFLEAAKHLFPRLEDESWIKFEKEVKEDLAKISIPVDINPGGMRETINQISALYQKIVGPETELKAELSNIEDQIDELQKINIGQAKNDLERKKNGIIACMNQKDENGNLINLLECRNEIRRRQNFLSGVLKYINTQKELLNNMSATLKLEERLLPQENGD